ncbi:hypothetical protein [Xanthomonas albilineans]|uniref:hypothetical protein n=1 Tax=Xanthomonas albilineans TaxID=29447 RepID=UPI001E56D938|nr:hypothetical protein [Xanthomonas albilineans]
MKLRGGAVLRPGAASAQCVVAVAGDDSAALRDLAQVVAVVPGVGSRAIAEQAVAVIIGITHRLLRGGLKKFIETHRRDCSRAPFTQATLSRKNTSAPKEKNINKIQQSQLMSNKKRDPEFSQNY